MSQALYRKWRPQSWDEVVGQDHIVQTLRNAVRAERVAHAYLFAGPRGTGKTTTARLLAKAINCTAPSLGDRPCNQCAHCLAVTEGRYLDLIEIDAASNTSVEDVRDLRDKINFAPNEGDFKVYIVDEVHMLSTAAFNALLKTLEEPPPHAIFVLATTEVHKIPATVLSRCQRHEFRRLPLAVIVDHLRRKLQEEGLEADAGVLELVSRQATGSMRDAISLLDQLASTGGPISLARAEAVLGTAAGEAVGHVLEALIVGDVASGLTWINRALDGGADPRQFARQVVDTLRGVLLARMGNAQLLEMTPGTGRRVRWARRWISLLAAIRAFNKAALEGRSGWQPGLVLELAFVESAQGPAADPPPQPQSPARRPTQPPPPRPAEPEMKAATADPHAPSPVIPAGGSPSHDRQPVEESPCGAQAIHELSAAQLLSPIGLEARVLVLGSPVTCCDKMEKGHGGTCPRGAAGGLRGPRRGEVGADLRRKRGRKAGGAPGSDRARWNGCHRTARFGSAGGRGQACAPRRLPVTARD
jgi:DNA polymerase-3 subunit gamma/tau